MRSGRLTARQIEADKRMILLDGGGLRLVRSSSGSASWVLRIARNGREFNIGLGAYPVVTLYKAREYALDTKRKIRDGIDPIAEKRQIKEIPNFERAATDCHAELAKTFRNPKHASLWLNTMRDYAFPQFGSVKIDQITHSHVFNALSKIWLVKNDTARRVRQRILKVIDWAVAKGYRAQPIPIAAINSGLPNYKIKVTHLAALPYDAIQGVLSNIRQEFSIPRLALELAILTGSRTGEIRKAAWSQFDFENNIWVRPDDIMKNNEVHIVPLSPQALEVLNKVKEVRTKTGNEKKDDVVFQGTSKIKVNDTKAQKQYIIDGVLSENTILNTLKPLLNGHKATTHGFRSTFRDWAREQTHFKDDVAEKCLSHINDNKVEAAYLRTNLMKERAQLLNLWANYCD